LEKHRIASEKRTGDVAGAIDAAKMSSLKEDLFNERYSNVEIKYSKYGVDDFDFRYYNPTAYSGLETHISNSYANSLLQLMHFTPLIRNLAFQHVATVDCKSDVCLGQYFLSRINIFVIEN
jgi:PAB-dependent poly(A)-specific ribonuclease subunit 2